METYFIQSFGIAAFLVNLCSFSTVKDNRLRALLFLSCMLFAVNYTLLGAYVAGINLLINGIRSIVSIRFSGLKWFALFAVIQTVMSALLYQTPMDLIPWTASMISGYALFCLSGLALRAAMLACTLTWMANAFVFGSWGGMMNDMVNATALMLTIYRLKRAEQKKALPATTEQPPAQSV